MAWAGRIAMSGWVLFANWQQSEAVVSKTTAPSDIRVRRWSGERGKCQPSLVPPSRYGAGWIEWGMQHDHSRMA